MIEVFYERVQEEALTRNAGSFYDTLYFLRKNVIKNFKKDDFFSDDSYNDHMVCLVESVVEGPNYTNRVKRNILWLLKSVDSFKDKSIILDNLPKTKTQENELGFNLFYFVDKIFFDSYYQNFCPDCSFCKERTIHPFTESAFAIQIASDTKRRKDYLEAWDIIHRLSSKCVCLDSPEAKSIVAFLSLLCF